MHTTLYSLAIALLLMVSCQGNTEPARQTKSEKEDKKANEAQMTPDMHNAKIALDYYGFYEGTLPCADCQGIKTEISLLPDQQYEKTSFYIGTDNTRHFMRAGRFKWKEDGNTIILNSSNGPNLYFVSENALFKLDKDGNRITGDLADKYILKKRQ